MMSLAPVLPASPAGQAVPAQPAQPPQPPVDYLLEQQIQHLKEQSFQKVEETSFELEKHRSELERVHEKMALLQADLFHKPFLAQVGGVGGGVGSGPWRKPGDEERIYRRGQEFLDRRDWDRAIEHFNAVAERKGTRADGALYWKAYALHKQGKRDEALAALAELEKSHSGSRWMNDAKVLQVEIRQAAGQPVTPETAADEEMKLFAINALINSEPERTVPLLEKILSSGRNSPRLKERALFVLAQSNSPQARDIVIRLARGGANPDLQLKGVEYLGHRRDNKENAKIVGEIYASTNDIAIKKAALQGLANAGARDQLLQAARSEPNLELRREAIHRLGNLRPPATDALVEIYNADSQQEVKKEVIHSLANHKAVAPLIDLARKENDVELKREAVQRLSQMKSKEATDFLVELLNK
jgi:HEAT repeat protein